jgi:pyruvate dehydrogenase E1 component alpha subunit
VNALGNTKKDNKAFLMKLLEGMLRIRKFESKAAECFLEGRINGNLHVCIGQESTIVGACSALNETDYITSTHRGHGHCIAKGAKTDRTLAELYGKETGYCQGRGGSMHVTRISAGVLGANGIVGGGIPIATGSALASKLNGDGAVTLAFFGDGAANQGCFHECANMAAAWKLPVVYLIENNRYAVSVEVSGVTNTASLSERAGAYGIPGITVDGTDVMSVYTAVREAVEYARQGKGPSVVECMTFRFLGHFVGDPAKYRSDTYLDEAQREDCIEKFKKKLLGGGATTQDEIDELEKQLDEEIERARMFAEESPFPDVSTVLDYNYTMDVERSVAR